MATSPTLEAFEAELKKYMAVETEIAAIPTLYNIGEILCQLPLLSRACCKVHCSQTLPQLNHT
jgi:hypothetical protein